MPSSFCSQVPSAFGMREQWRFVTFAGKACLAGSFSVRYEETVAFCDICGERVSRKFLQRLRRCSFARVFALFLTTAFLGAGFGS